MWSFNYSSFFFGPRSWTFFFCLLVLLHISATVPNRKQKSIYVTGKSVSEAHILESVNPQYDERLLIEFPKKYKFRTCKQFRKFRLNTRDSIGMKKSFCAI